MSQQLSTQQELNQAVEEMDFLADGFWEEEREIPIQESTLKEFVPLNTDVRGEEGQNSREWSEVLDDFGSKRLYQERLADFLHFASVDYSSATLEMKLVNYFNDARAQTNPDGSARYRYDLSIMAINFFQILETLQTQGPKDAGTYFGGQNKQMGKEANRSETGEMFL